MCRYAQYRTDKVQVGCSRVCGSLGLPEGRDRLGGTRSRIFYYINLKLKIYSIMDSIDDKLQTLFTSFDEVQSLAKKMKEARKRLKDAKSVVLNHMVVEEHTTLKCPTSGRQIQLNQSIVFDK